MKQVIDKYILWNIYEVTSLDELSVPIDIIISLIFILLDSFMHIVMDGCVYMCVCMHTHDLYMYFYI